MAAFVPVFLVCSWMVHATQASPLTAKSPFRFCSPKGSWNNEQAQDNCNPCAPGKYSNTLGSKECKVRMERRCVLLCVRVWRCKAEVQAAVLQG